ncbi:hypothetical protein R3P38DRAFT_2950727 [Favolaschia claudopus]|uniref:Secreted protein n=1 Tax=Favolaschia claudopus TaxID=2862362 RepID=A0AAW0BE35_9AGAR
MYVVDLVFSVFLFIIRVLFTLRWLQNTVHPHSRPHSSFSMSAVSIPASLCRFICPHAIVLLTPGKGTTQPDYEEYEARCFSCRITLALSLASILTLRSPLFFFSRVLRRLSS